MKHLIFIILLTFVIGNSLAQDQSPVNKSVRYRALFVYGFTRYVEWPENYKSGNFRIATVGADEDFLKEMENLAKKKLVGNQKIEFIELPLDANLEKAGTFHVIYIDKSQRKSFSIKEIPKYTLLISYNEIDLYNSMITFVETDEKLKFAFNSYLTRKSGLKVNEDFRRLAVYNVDDTKSKSENEQITIQWANVAEKINAGVNSGVDQIKLSGKELNEISNKIKQQEKNIEIKSKELENLNSELNQKESQLNKKQTEIDHQKLNLEEQKKRIDDQSMELLTQEQKLKLQEEKLNLTIAQNILQEEDLQVKKEELYAQQRRIGKQKEVLEEQKKNIRIQEEKLFSQLEKINTQRTIIWLGLAAVIAIVCSLYLVYRNYSKSRKTNQLLALQKTEIQSQKQLIEEKHREITDSIHYAERIQRSFLASKEFLDHHLPDYFILFKPKDVVSGDFYWATLLRNGELALVTADSTGHGVPGAIMSLLNTSGLEKAVETQSEPAEILNHTRRSIIERLKRDGSAEGGKDGMDCSLISLNLQGLKMTYAAANNPVWIHRDAQLIELDPDKMPVGKHDRDHLSFTQHSVELKKGDIIYTLTDGMPDQFGGPKGKKFMYKQLKSLLVSVAPSPMAQQKTELESALRNWMGDHEQVDDICVIGIRV